MIDKFNQAIIGTTYDKLSTKLQNFIKDKSIQHKLSFQEIKIIIDMAVDLVMWQEKSLDELWPIFNDNDSKEIKGKELNKKIISSLKNKIDELRATSKDYNSFNKELPRKTTSSIIQKDSAHTILGDCPVASEKTRCCNLKTLDVVRNCGFDCSYCSIQSFYYDDNVYFDAKLGEKLQKLDLDKDRLYHIGTGQSSDSLMWGNQNELLSDLFKFASNNPNVILELKTKSSNIKYLLDHDIPKNVITTWSLNTPSIIAHEEHLTASLDERLSAAKQIAAKGNLVGFHFHPMVYYKNWKDDYANISREIVNNFRPSQIAMISIGTLTFIRPAIKKLKQRMMRSKILQMPFVEIAGKLSYPYNIKKEMFSHLYNSFPKAWHYEIFFYMCMEDIGLWDDVFHRSYQNNEEFEQDMIQNYNRKIAKK